MPLASLGIGFECFLLWGNDTYPRCFAYEATRGIALCG